jgi:hypothetical protein
MDDLALNVITWILGVEINASVSIETHMTYKSIYDKPFIYYEKVIEKFI